MAEHSRRSLEAELQRCQVEIQSARSQLLDGHPDIQGLVLALSDWCQEERIIRELLRSAAEADRNPESRGQPWQASVQRPGATAGRGPATDAEAPERVGEEGMEAPLPDAGTDAGVDRGRRHRAG